MKVTLVKLGGGLIAPKDWEPETPDVKTIKRLVAEIEAAGQRVIVAVGSGNFGHAAVAKYGIAEESGVEKVRVIAKEIGAIVASEIKNSQLVVTHELPWNMAKILDGGKTPVIYGDVMRVKEIWSGERCLLEMIPELEEAGWKVERIVQVGREEGVWDRDKKILPKIDTGNWAEIRSGVGGSGGIDVTGGMRHKVEESLEIAKKYGIETWIISGQAPGRVTEAVRGKETPGTKITY